MIVARTRCPRCTGNLIIDQETPTRPYAGITCLACGREWGRIELRRTEDGIELGALVECNLLSPTTQHTQRRNHASRTYNRAIH